LLRHGDTEHTSRKLFSGSGGADPPLTSTGTAQATAAGRALTDRGVDVVVSSPMRRARETADVVATALRLSVSEIEELRECAFGEWEGHSFAEVRERWPEELAAWLASPSVAPPGGESFDAVGRRVRRARDKLIARHPGKSILVVSHVTPIKTLVRLSLGAPASSLYRMELSSASLSEIQWYGDGNASLRRFNEVFS
jgi:probable phosphoglycerate mutase